MKRFSLGLFCVLSLASIISCSDDSQPIVPPQSNEPSGPPTNDSSDNTTGAPAPADPGVPKLPNPFSPPEGESEITYETITLKNGSKAYQFKDAEGKITKISYWPDKVVLTEQETDKPGLLISDYTLPGVRAGKGYLTAEINWVASEELKEALSEIRSQSPEVELIPLIQVGDVSLQIHTNYAHTEYKKDMVFSFDGPKANVQITLSHAGLAHYKTLAKKDRTQSVEIHTKVEGLKETHDSGFTSMPVFLGEIPVVKLPPAEVSTPATVASLLLQGEKTAHTIHSIYGSQEVTLSFDVNTDEKGRSELIVHADGEIPVIFGKYNTGTNEYDGYAKRDFGKKTFEPLGMMLLPESGELQYNNEILVAGTLHKKGKDAEFLVVHFNYNGTYKRHFQAGRHMVFPQSREDYLKAMDIQIDPSTGKTTRIVLAGDSTNGYEGERAIALAFISMHETKEKIAVTLANFFGENRRAKAKNMSVESLEILSDKEVAVHAMGVRETKLGDLVDGQPITRKNRIRSFTHNNGRNHTMEFRQEIVAATVFYKEDDKGRMVPDRTNGLPYVLKQTGVGVWPFDLRDYRLQPTLAEELRELVSPNQ